jgi:hypothetical protein
LGKKSVSKKEKLDKLDSIASSVKRTGEVPALQDRWEAARIDCFLYAQDDHYK